MKPKDISVEKSIRLLGTLKRRKVKMENNMVINHLSQLFTTLSNQIQIKNKKGKLLHWRVRYETVEDNDTTQNGVKFNLQFRDKIKALMDLNISFDKEGDLYLDGGLIDPELVIKTERSEDITALANSAAFKKHFTLTKDATYNQLYRLTSIVSLSQLNNKTFYDSLDAIIFQMGLFYDLLLDRIPQRSIVV